MPNFFVADAYCCCCCCCRRLGVTRDASYEEVQEARNYLVEQYAGHDPSREAIELALDDILQVGGGEMR